MYVRRRCSVGVLSRLQLPFYGMTKGSSVVRNVQLARKGRRGVLTGGNVLAGFLHYGAVLMKAPFNGPSHECF